MLTEQREYSVVKANVLIQKTRFTLSLQEQKIILRLIQMITPEDKELKLYKFSIKEFCNFCGIDNTSGKNYSNIKNTLKKLSDKSYWIILPNGKKTIVRWIEKPYIDPRGGVIELKLDNDMKPFLLQLKEHFTAYSLYYTITMKSKYSIRMYELLKSYQNMSKCNFDILELKKALMTEKYTQWNDFKRYVLTPSLKEINLLTDLEITYDLQKEGKQFSHIIFTIRHKTDISERLEAWNEIEQRLNSKQIKGQLSLLLDGVANNE